MLQSYTQHHTMIVTNRHRYLRSGLPANDEHLLALISYMVPHLLCSDTYLHVNGILVVGNECDGSQTVGQYTMYCHHRKYHYSNAGQPELPDCKGITAFPQDLVFKVIRTMDT